MLRSLDGNDHVRPERILLGIVASVGWCTCTGGAIVHIEDDDEDVMRGVVLTVVVRDETGTEKAVENVGITEEVRGWAEADDEDVSTLTLETIEGVDDDVDNPVVLDIPADL